jgi:hypothetical protein
VPIFTDIGDLGHPGLVAHVKEVVRPPSTADAPERPRSNGGGILRFFGTIFFSAPLETVVQSLISPDSVCTRLSCCSNPLMKGPYIRGRGDREP